VDPLDPLRLRRMLPARLRAGRRIEVLARVDSTNDALRRRLAEGRAGDGEVLAAEVQVGGRGRRARDWWSGPPGANLAVSVLLQPPPRPPEAVGVAAAVAAARALQPWTGEPLALRWPNDLLLGGRKLGGFLAEMPAAGSGPAAILGFGLNVHAAPPDEGLRTPAIGLDEAAGPGAPPRDRTRILALWLLGLDRELLRLERSGPASLEERFLAGLRRWAPRGVRPRDGGGPAGPLVEFSVSRGLTWGPEGARVTRPPGLVPPLEPLPPA